MIAAIEHIDAGAVIRLLRSHPMTRHLSQTALSLMTGTSQATISRWETNGKIPNPRHAVTALQGLGVPGVPWGGRWLLPEEITNDTTPIPTPASETTPAPCVTITAPGPFDVQVMQPTEGNDDPTGAIVFVSDQKGPRLIVAPGSTWGVTNTPTGSTAWFALAPHERSSLTAPPCERPPMTPGTIFWTAFAIYLSVGMLLSLRDVTAVATADTEALCSDACRAWHKQALEPVRAMYEMPIVAPFAIAISGLAWPWALKTRCGCFRKAAQSDST